MKVTALADAPDSERRRAAGQLIEALIAAPLFAPGERSVFHADPHAGNLLYDQRTGELVLLDWALTESLTRDRAGTPLCSRSCWACATQSARAAKSKRWLWDGSARRTAALCANT